MPSVTTRMSGESRYSEPTMVGRERSERSRRAMDEAVRRARLVGHERPPNSTSAMPFRGHTRWARSRKALPMTETEESDIAPAATMGERSTPRNG